MRKQTQEGHKHDAGFSWAEKPLLVISRALTRRARMAFEILLVWWPGLAGIDLLQ